MIPSHPGHARIVPAATPEDLYGRICVRASGLSVLDVGSGIAPYHERLAAAARRLVLLDAHRPYLEHSERKLREAGHAAASTICGHAPLILPALYACSFDLVLGIDFIEHLEKPDALLVVREMQRIAAMQIILFVPEGNHPQSTDVFGLGGDYWQTHRSTWHAEDLEALGFVVERWVDFHAGTPGKDSGALWCEWCRCNREGG